MGSIDSTVPNTESLPYPSIFLLKFPFSLKEDQLAAVESWVDNGYRGTILYSTGTGKTEIAFECSKRLMIAYSGFTSTFSKNTNVHATARSRG